MKRKAEPTARVPRRRKAPVREGSATYHVVHIELFDIDPPIWRDLLVPSDATLATLHEAIQAAFPWTNSHLHAFRTGRSELTDTEGDPDAGRAEERRFTLADVLPRVGSRLQYKYDFGDSWFHDVAVREIRRAEAGEAKQRLKCLGGSRACPPEDCGGSGGYENLLNALRSPNHREHEDLTQWLREHREELAGYDERFRGSFDPEAFDLDAANRALARVGQGGKGR